MKWLLVFAFGGLGAVCRVGVAGLFSVRALPWGTLLVNLVGCLLIGVLFELFEERQVLPLELRLAVVGGFLGGFTTFSAYSLEILQLARTGQWLWAAAYAVGSVVLGVVAAGAGAITARQLL